MWISRAAVLACAALLCSETKADTRIAPVDHASAGHTSAWTASASDNPIDLYPLLDTGLRRDGTPDPDADAPESMTGDARAIAYPMVPAPPAGESGAAFGGLLAVFLGWRFWRYGRVSFR